MVEKAEPLIIIGAGGMGREVAWLARSLPKQWNLIGFLDDSETLQEECVCEVPVLGRICDWERFSDSCFVVAIGSPRVRKAIVEVISAYGHIKFATLVHPSVMRSVYVTIQEGTTVCAGSILTTQVSIGRHCIINLAVTLSHDVSIGDYCTLSPQVAVAGNVSVGKGVEIGTGAMIIPRVAIGEGNVIGAGAVVTRSTAPNIVAVGTPARGIKSLDPISDEAGWQEHVSLPPADTIRQQGVPGPSSRLGCVDSVGQGFANRQKSTRVTG